MSESKSRWWLHRLLDLCLLALLIVIVLLLFVTCGCAINFGSGVSDVVVMDEKTLHGTNRVVDVKLR
jgi:hypothetical protein